MSCNRYGWKCPHYNWFPCIFRRIFSYFLPRAIFTTHNIKYHNYLNRWVINLGHYVDKWIFTPNPSVNKSHTKLSNKTASHIQHINSPSTRSAYIIQPINCAVINYNRIDFTVLCIRKTHFLYTMIARGWFWFDSNKTRTLSYICNLSYL